MVNTTSDAVMTGVGPGTDVNAAVKYTDNDDDIANQEIVTPPPAVIDDRGGTLHNDNCE